MLNIAICDDAPSLVDKVEELLIRYQNEHGEVFNIKKFYNGIQLVECKEEFELIFLDIKMPLMDGIETAHQIRKKNKTVDIIFLTSLIGYALEGYKIKAINYIIKPISYKQIKHEMDQWIRRNQQEESAFIGVKNDSGYYRIFLKSIYFIETYDRNLLIHTDEDNIVCYRKMKDMEQKLTADGFARCHAGYLVNLRCIASIEKLEIHLISNEYIPISKNRRKEFLENLAKYWGRNL